MQQNDKGTLLKQNYDWLIRFGGKGDAIDFSREMFILCEAKLRHITECVENGDVTDSDFPAEVKRLRDMKNNDTYRYWHDNELAVPICKWDHAGYVNGIMDGSESFANAGNDGFYNLFSIRSDTLSFDMHMGDELFLPPTYYYNKIAYVKPTDVSNMLYIYPSAIGRPENYYARSFDTHVDRQEPYDFTVPEPNATNLDRDLAAYMQRI